MALHFYYDEMSNTAEDAKRRHDLEQTHIAKPSQEISMQHFLSNVLASGRVQKLVVVNGTLVRVHCRRLK